MERGIALAALALAAHPAAAASFDCARAASKAETVICADPALSKLDERLARNYAGARVAVKEGAGCLQGDQRAWLARRDRCDDRGCLEAIYLDRLAELEGLQPGATATRDLRLPDRPTLVWVIPPAADRVAAPPNPKAHPQEITGQILDEVATGDGFVLRAANGERRLVVPLMFLEGSTAAHLEALSRQKDARFSVRGHAISREDRRDFEPSRCAFVYRRPAAGRVHGDPSRAVEGFKPHELPFELVADGIARPELRSDEFFAVILRTAPRCSLKEADRRAAQAMFPAHKVFATRFECEDGLEEHLTYTNVDPKWGFLAAYGGTTASEAEAVLRAAQATGRFPGANVRKMQAVRVSP